ncbi:heavy metal translocating P-type ATPase [Nitrincola tibetensis]|uniref:P-type Zn(2+) transporter n=1 Tax=Nitrincola tibetensis TaxID=2219697 RepID=A0A364NQZ6_9GAMM|nr:heavy metal translocating P-type ATPase [Nitrincola tibetensis]RAU19430.1 heavy metal translocating P-type ATPase [Nitrincola tibetensis]
MSNCCGSSSCSSNQTPSLAPAKVSPIPYIKLSFAGGAALLAEVIEWTLPGWGWISLMLALVAIALCGTEVLKRGWLSLLKLDLTINALMSLAVTCALLIGHWAEAAMVLVLFTLAEWIEEKSVERARHAIQSVLSLAPDTARVLMDDGHWQSLPVTQVKIGQHVQVQPGERIGLDGRILKGHTFINQAAITGESLAVEKQLGDSVYAGTLNETELFEFQVTAEASNTTLARIIKRVEEAQADKAPTQRLVDQFARIYTPIIFFIALATALVPPVLFGGAFLDWLYRALVLLVIACPCALVISTPVTIVSGLARAARLGILIKGGSHLEAGSRLNRVAFDKTGTLTQGQPELRSFKNLSGMPDEDVLRLASSIAQHSSHPVSKTLTLAHVGERLTVESLIALPGQGLQVALNSHRYGLGNDRLARAMNVPLEAYTADVARIESQGESCVLLIEDARVLGLFGVADPLKPNSQEAINALHSLGLRTLMLSGDNLNTARAIAQEVGITDVQANLMPEDKLEAIKNIMKEGHQVAMVGDGINDAPALAQANLGLAMGAAGTDTAIETADIALMDDDPRKIATYIRLSRFCMRLLKQNIALAIGIKCIFILLAFQGQASMWMAVFADMGVSLLVVANGLRALKFKHLSL